MKKSCLIVTLIAAGALMFSVSGGNAAQKSAELPAVGINKFQGETHSLTIDRQLITPTFKTDVAKMFVHPQAAQLLQGGEDISTAVEIPSLPYTTTGTTVGYNDDYDEACDIASTSPDVVYYYIATGHDLLDINLCGAGTDYRTHLWAYENSEAQLIACNRFSAECGGQLKSALTNVEVFAGNTYYIVVDGDYGASGNYELDITSTPAPPSFARHPGLADAGTGSMVFTYEYESPLDTQLYWLGTDDGGATISPAIYWNLENLATEPSIEYFGSGNQFYGTFTAPYQAVDSGGTVYVVEIADPVNPGAWTLKAFGWEQYGWHDMRMADIATYNAPDIWNWGMISMIHSTHYGSPEVNDGPHITYPISSSQASLNWFTGVDGCNSTECDIDPITQRGIAVYDVYDSDSSQWVLFLTQVFVNDWNADFNAWIYDVGTVNEHVQNPSVATYNGRVIVATEYWPEAAGDDRDIIVWMTSDSDMINMDYTVLVNTPDPERYPKIEHVVDETFILSFHRNDSFFTMYTTDNGNTWTDPKAYILQGSHAVGEYRFSDFGDNGTYAIWEYRDDGDSAINVRFDYTQIVDEDLDGWPDINDNCPTVYNPTQADADGTPPGDACCCLGIRGNTNGDIEDKLNVSDVTYLVKYLFGVPTGPAPICPAEANTNGDLEEKLNVTDITYLVKYLFGVPTGPAPPSCPNL